MVSNSHLSGHSVLPGHFGCDAYLVDILTERLFAIDVLAHSHRRHTGRDMGMVGRRHHCRVDVLLFPVEQLAEIIVSPGLGKPLEARIVGVSNLWMVVTDRLMGSFLVDIANCNDIDTAQMTLPVLSNRKRLR